VIREQLQSVLLSRKCISKYKL